MRVYGVDFTCAPRKAKPITVACGTLKGNRLTVQAIQGLESFEAFEAFLATPGPWIGVAAATFTAWNGPWGTSFTANLTPDKETGLGDWTVDQFIATMKTGKDRGKGRPVLPPMPVQNLAQLSDEDIRALFAYLQTLKPIKNRVPQPIDPPEGR